MEEWRDIAGYEGYYMVSNHGSVIALPVDGMVRRKTLLKANTSWNGYLRVGLRRNGKTKFCMVHRLVAASFIENKNNKPIINHKDGNKQNNHVSNIEWCTHKENTEHAFDSGLIVRNIKKARNHERAFLIDELIILESAKSGKSIHKINGELKSILGFDSSRFKRLRVAGVHSFIKFETYVSLANYFGCKIDQLLNPSVFSESKLNPTNV